jgi:protein involved in polysaccharide export with SLBB domain
MINRKTIGWSFLFCILWSGYSFSQDVSEAKSDVELSLSPSAQLALSTPDYRVTAGDVYTLAYLAGSTAVEYTITVDSSYQIRISNLGIINGGGKTFTQLKNQIEAIVSNNYPLGGVQFILKQPATFKVYIRGEVRTTTEISTWALMRVGSIVGAYITPYSSTRDVTIKSSNGQVKVYDLYKAQRLGDLSQNPYVRPDDIITINRVKRRVGINGAVERPGTYQLLAGEQIKELIEFYGYGFTPVADPSRIVVTRLVDSPSKSGETIALSEQDIANNFVLQHYDTVMVPNISDLRPVMFIEGAIGAVSTEGVEAASPEASTRFTVTFIRGEYYGSLIRRHRGWFTAVSDTKNAYLIRGDEYIPVNLNPMLYDENFRGDLLVQENDTLIIPFRQYFVTVAGAVVTPGRYPYIPDRAWDYYVALAGGFVNERNTGESIDIVDISGKKLSKTSIITPETIITAKTNSFFYYFSRYAPVVTTLLSIATTLISAFLLTK